MDSLDIQIVDSLTVNLNQEDYSTEGQVLNTIDVYVEDEQLLFETALTQDSINLYTRETPDTIIFDAKEITDGISKLESLIEKTSKESTLTSGVNELKTTIENIDLSSVESKVEEVGNKIDNIKLPEIDTTELAKQGDDKNATLTAIYKMLVGNDEPSQDIPEGVAERLALILEFFGMKPIETYEFMTVEEVCSELEEIMTSMDINLTPEKAKEITNNTLNKE